jgi:hypothetical protein
VTLHRALSSATTDMSMDVLNRPIRHCHHHHTSGRLESTGRQKSSCRPTVRLTDISQFCCFVLWRRPALDSEPSGSDANPGIAVTLTFARSTPTRPESVGGPRFFRTHQTSAGGRQHYRPGMTRSGIRREAISVHSSVVRTCPRVLPPVGTGGTLRTWLTRDDVRVANCHF